MGRPREHDESTRAALLGIARRMLLEQGAEGLGLRGIASQCDTSTRAVYSVFGSKENLVRALYRDGFAALLAQCRDCPRTADPRADLFAVATVYREFARTQTTLWRLMCERLIAEFEPTCEDRAEALAALLQIAERLADCLRAGLLGDHSPEEFDGRLDDLTRQFWAVLHGLAALEIRGFLGEPDDATRRWTSTLSALFAGSGPSQAR